MSRKHNVKHNRSKSRYPDRLRARGVTGASVRMPTVETLRKQAAARERGEQETETETTEEVA